MPRTYGARSYPNPRPHRTVRRAFVSTMAALLIMAFLGVVTDASTTTKPYTASWAYQVSPQTANRNVAPGANSIHLFLENDANPQSLGSADITLPSTYTLTGGSASSLTATVAVSGNTLQLRNLNLASGATLDVTVNFSTPCVGGGQPDGWTIVVKQANNFSGPPGNDFVPSPGTSPLSTTIAGSSQCLLVLVNQPAATRTNAIITDGFDSSGASIAVQIVDPTTHSVVDSSATVTLQTVTDSTGNTPGSVTGGTLTGGSVSAVHGVATFSSLSLDKAGAYYLMASSTVASNHPVTNQFVIADTLGTCSGPGCSFSPSDPTTTGSVTISPTKGVKNAQFVGTVNLGMTVSCDFSPYNYPDTRQPNAVWYQYSDGGQSSKTNVIVIDKSVVQITPNNGTSFYRVCYSSPTDFIDINGQLAPEDPWGAAGPEGYFGGTWYTGLLPNCAKKNQDPTQPCVVSWTGDNAGDRVGTFLTPPGDPAYR